MRRTRNLSAVFVVMLAAVVAFGAKPKFISPDDIDVSAILSGPPAVDSAEHQQEIATLLQWQNKRTAEDVHRCEKEANADGFLFASVLGDWFNPRMLPITANLLEQSAADAKAIYNPAKSKWNRPRPYIEDQRIHPCVELEDSSSYPSGHAVRGILWASILSEMFPEHRDELMATGRQFGNDRVIAGVHWPSDVAAGQKLGGEIASRLLDNSDFRAEMQRAKDECTVGAH